MQEPPPYQPPPYQPPPPGGFGAPGAPPPMAPPSVDRLRVPMQLLIAASGVAILRTLVFAVWTTVLRRSGNYSMYRLMPPVQTLLAVIIAALFIAGAVMISQQKRPGHAFALGAAIASGVSLVLTFGFLVVPSLARGGLMSVSLLHSVVGATALGTLALGLRELARSRERPVDPYAFAVLGLVGLTVMMSIVGRSGFALGEAGKYVGVLLAIAAQAAIIAMAARIMSYVPAAEFAMGDGSAYRGPLGAHSLDAAAPGSVALGFLAGFFGGCIGLGLVLMLAKGQATKRGAGIGFACQTVVGIGLRAAAH